MIADSLLGWIVLRLFLTLILTNLELQSKLKMSFHTEEYPQNIADDTNQGK